MDIKKLKSVLNSGLPNDLIEFRIVMILAQDENVISNILKILNAERSHQKELLRDMNVLLSKADCGLDDAKVNHDNFMQKEIKEFYTKYKDDVGHCFKNLNKDKAVQESDATKMPNEKNAGNQNTD